MIIRNTKNLAVMTYRSCLNIRAAFAENQSGPGVPHTSAKYGAHDYPDKLRQSLTLSHTPAPAGVEPRIGICS